VVGQQDRHQGALIAWSIVALISTASFGFLLWSVLAHGGLTMVDPAVANFIAAHRPGWLTPMMQLVTWLGSSVLIIPIGLAVGGYLRRRRHTWQPLIMLTAAFLGAAALYDIVKPTVARQRPPAALQVGGPDLGWAFPSGHATQSIAFYGMLAVVIIAWWVSNRRLLVILGAALLTLVIGASRLYLGVHWLTDVLGGYALGLTWLSLVMITSMLVKDWNQPRQAMPPHVGPAGSGSPQT
jgi:undecaprenyl-diphosphatase